MRVLVLRLVSRQVLAAKVDTVTTTVAAKVAMVVVVRKSLDPMAVL